MILAVANGAKILGVFPGYAHSHFTLGFTLMKELADRGHEVTFINSFPQKNPIKNLRDLPIEGLKSRMDSFHRLFAETGDYSIWDQMDFMYRMSIMYTETVLKAKNVQDLLNSDEKFDLVILEQFANEAMNMKEFMDNATDGVVVFSMGSNLNSADFDPEKKKAILEAFSKIKQKVLWKFETDLEEKPSNVMISKWLPQQDALGHPNTVAFITHCGLLGTIEAVYYGVPQLGLPMFWDQYRNIEESIRREMAIKLNYDDLTKDSFEKALKEILENPKYRENAKLRSRIMRDQPMKQLDEAVFWVEYVIRYEGAPHLRSAAMDLRWYQKYMVDIFLFVGFVCISLFVFLRVLFKYYVYSRKVPVNYLKKYR
ncbi:hypothetical protein JTB14_024331 [Gonioctena quinquepunctata]|nr:hypothetical protein JTB14_024331 [Gonioctena quinquepunctata]